MNIVLVAKRVSPEDATTLTMTYQEEGQEVVQFFLLRAPVEAHTTGIQQGANDAHPEEIIRHVQGGHLLRQGPSIG